MFSMARNKKCTKLKKFLGNIDSPIFDTPIEYRKSKAEHIDVLRWLLASYEMKNAVSPKEMLEHVLQNYYWDAQRKIIWVEILYHWIYNDKIVGF